MPPPQKPVAREEGEIQVYVNIKEAQENSKRGKALSEKGEPSPNSLKKK